MRLIAIATAASLLGAAACGSADHPAGPPADALRVDVAPLTLPGVEEVTYGITVRSADEVVWAETGLTSTRFGDGRSALSYVGPCDASANPHAVELTVENIRAGGVDLVDPDDFSNPAPPGSPLVREGITCVENADVLVAFDLTVLRSAGQGFVDVAVAFDDIFCSAKLDCRERFLHHPETGEREATVIVALACTTGEGTTTYMHASDLTLTCQVQMEAGAATYVLENDGTVGQHGPVRAYPSGLFGNAPGIYQWATYQGREELTSNGEPLEKCFWNRAIGLDLAALSLLGVESCTLSGVATATQTADGLAALGQPGSSYPIVRWDVEVLGPDGSLCDNHPLNGTPVGVTTEYVTAESAVDLSGATSLACGGALAPSVACGAGAAQVVQDADGLITVTTAAGAQQIALEGVELSDTCCVDPCCAEL